MTAVVEISLYMGYLHGIIIDSVGLSHFGDTRPVGRGHSQKIFSIYFSMYFLYVGGRNHFGG